MHSVRPLFAPLLLLTLAVGCKSSDDAPASTGPTRADSLRMVAEGTNKELQFKADAPGEIIVSNFTKGDYLYKGTLKKGETFVLIPNSSRAMVNKDWVNLDHDTNTHDVYRLYFLNNP
jgi:hypothetical protein